MSAPGLELIHQNSAPSLLRNGSFTQGLSHWFGSYCRYNEAVSEIVANPPNQTPKYIAEINLVDRQFYMDGLTPGLNQFIDRPDLHSFPSVRVVSGLRMVVVEEDKALLMIQPSLTAVDGTLVEAVTGSATPTYANYFQHPFVFRDTGSIVPIKVGAIIHVADARTPENSELYRAVKLWMNYGAGAVAPTTGEEHLYSYHAVEIVAPQRTFTPYASSEEGKVNFSIAWTSTQAVVTITGDIDRLMASERNQLGFYTTGPAIGDTLILDGYATVISTDPFVSSTSIELVIEPISNFGQNIKPFIPQDVDATTWAFHAPAVVTAVISKDLHKYEFTAFHTYEVSTGLACDTTLRFLELRAENGKDYLTTQGFGFDGELIPRVDSRSETIKLDDGTANPDGSWRRRAEYFIRETTEPIKGRLQMTLQPVMGTTPDAFGLFPVLTLGYDVLGTYNSVVYPNGRLSIGVQRSFTAQPIAGYTFRVSAAIVTLETAWRDALASGALSLKDSSQVTPTFTFLYVDWPVGITEPQELGTVNVTPPNTAQMFGVANYAKARIGDAYLIKGNQSSRFQVVDDVVFPIQYPLNENVLLDSIQHKTDELDNILPKGAVVLYAGGGVCPTGFKRVDGFADSEDPGIPGQHLIPLPDPLLNETLVYDEDTNRTRLTWIKDFPALDKFGVPITLSELTVPKVFTLDPNPVNPVYEVVQAKAVQQVMQPGMRFRYSSFTTPLSVTGNAGNPLFNNTSPGNAVRTQPVIGNQVTSGRLHLPVYDAIKIGPAFPNTGSVIFEIWGRLNALPVSGSGILAQQRLNGGNGWEVSINSLGNVTMLLSQGNTVSSYTTTSQPLRFNPPLTSSNMGFLHIVIYLRPRDANPSLEDGSSIEIRTGNGQVLGQIFNMSAGVTTLTASSDIYLGRGGPTLIGSGLNFTFDSFRIFRASVMTASAATLWNNGTGISDLSQVPGAGSALLAEYRFDETTSSGSQLINSISVTGALDGIAEGSYLRESGQLLAVGNGAFPKESFGYVREDVDPSFLITNLEYQYSDEQANLPPVAPFSSSGSRWGSGAAGLLPNNVGQTPITIAYPYILRSGLTISSADLSSAPPGPREAADQTARIGNSILGATPNTFRTRVHSVTKVSGLITRATVQYDDPNNPSLHPDDLSFSANLTVDDVYFFTWTDSNGATGTFFGRVTSIDVDNARYVIRRYNEPYFNWPGAVTSGSINIYLTVRPAILFGKSLQGIDPTTQIVQISGVTTTRTDASGTVYWSYRLFSYQITASVYGRLEPKPGLTNLQLEPSGYLLYDDPAADMAYGDSGHSHLVDQGNVTTVIDKVPRVNEISVNAAYRNAPFIAVASKHTHGFLSKYRYTIPKFRTFTLCEKL